MKRHDLQVTTPHIQKIRAQIRFMGNTNNTRRQHPPTLARCPPHIQQTLL
jgi:hypothetical protein